VSLFERALIAVFLGLTSALVIWLACTFQTGFPHA